MNEDYSQYEEQKFIVRFFQEKNKGLLLDVGAADGTTNSNSKKLIELGWVAYLIEPGRKNYEKLKKLYSNNDKVKLFNIGLSDENHEKATFYNDKNDEYEQISTFSKEQYNFCEDYFKCKFNEDFIDLVSTNDFLNENNLSEIDFISIDTEGLDSKIIKNIDFTKTKIKLICVEKIDDESIDYLNINNYKLIHTTIGNAFYSPL